MTAISNFIASAVVLTIIGGAIVFMFSPKAGGEIFKRIGIVLVILLVGVPLVIGLIRELVHSLWPWWFFFFFLVVSATAYLVRESLAGRNRKPLGKPYGAERTPVPPNISKEEEESDGNNSVGAG